MKVIHTNKAPLAIGPYSQAIKAGNFVFISGQIPVDPKTSEVVLGDVKQQTKQCLENLLAIIQESNCSLKDVVKCSLFIKDMTDFRIINEVYATYFSEHKPARACVEVARLPKDVLVEIEAIVYCP